MDASQPRAGAVRLLLDGECLRRQVTEFLDSLGLIVADEQNLFPVCLVITDAPLRCWAAIGHQASQAGGNVLFLTTEPDHIAREMLPNARTDCIEKPFAWRDLAEKVRGNMTASVYTAAG